MRGCNVGREQPQIRQMRQAAPPMRDLSSQTQSQQWQARLSLRRQVLELKILVKTQPYNSSTSKERKLLTSSGKLRDTTDLNNLRSS